MKKLINWFHNILASWQFKRAKKQLKNNVDFNIMVDESNEELMTVHVLTGKYKGICIQYSKLDIRDDGLMSFDVSYLTKEEWNTDTNDKKLVSLTQDIMRIIITDAFENLGRLQNESRASDSVELDEQRDLFEEDVPVSKKKLSKRKL